MSIVSKEKSSKSLFQGFDMMRSHFYAEGFRFAKRLFTLRDQLLNLLVKQNGRQIIQRDLENVFNEVDHIISDLNQLRDLDAYSELQPALVSISISLKKEQFQGALGILLNIIQPAPSVPLVSQIVPSTTLLTDPPILAV